MLWKYSKKQQKSHSISSTSILTKRKEMSVIERLTLKGIVSEFYI